MHRPSDVIEDMSVGCHRPDHESQVLFSEYTLQLFHAPDHVLVLLVLECDFSLFYVMLEYGP